LGDGIFGASEILGRSEYLRVREGRDGRQGLGGSECDRPESKSRGELLGVAADVREGAPRSAAGWDICASFSAARPDMMLKSESDGGTKERSGPLIKCKDQPWEY
jgi:hypothetical protein